MRRSAAVLAAAASLALAPAVAGAQVGPLAPAPQTAPQSPPPAPAPSQHSSDDGSLSAWQQVLIFGGGAALLAGIAWVIVRDAHRAAPVAERSQAGRQSPLSAHERERRRRRERERAKAARRQRKRNRPR